MAQTPATYRHLGDNIDYTPGSAVTAGDVIVIGSTLTAIAPSDIAASAKGALNVRGVWNVPKDDSDVSAGDALYWDANGSPVGGTALSGAFTKTATANTFAGIALEAAGTTVGDVDLLLRSIDGTVPGAWTPIPVQTIVAGGNVQANANAIPGAGFTLVTGADNAKAAVLPSASAGLVCVVKNAEAAKLLPVFPAASDTINGAAANAVYNIGNGAMRTFVAYNAVAWFAAPETENV